MLNVLMADGNTDLFVDIEKLGVGAGDQQTLNKASYCGCGVQGEKRQEKRTEKLKEGKRVVTRVSPGPDLWIKQN